MALSWSYKRRLIYGGGTLLFLTLVVGGIFYWMIYKAPTCFDGKKNGGEKGIDCGGSCTVLCKNDTVDPIVMWSKIFNVSGDLYSAVAYVDNPNLESRNPRVQYEFKIFDDKHNLIDTKSGFISIPKNKKIAIFEPGFVFKNAKPKYAEFQFTSFSLWETDKTMEPKISLSHSSLLSTSTIPRVEGKIYNDSSEDVAELELVTLVLDSKENVVAASRTFINDLAKKTSQDFVFTWPKPFNLGVESCVNTVDLALILDKSGSMKSENLSPPEPFETVKKTAQDFIKNLSEKDQVSVFSFGDLGKLESGLSADKSTAVSAVNSLSLGTTSQQTNITDGLTVAWNELKSQNAKQENKKVMILLTDGAPTAPKSTSTPDYPRLSAESLARDIISSDTIVYTIGLGKDVNDGFLKNISGSDDRYFFAPGKETLSGIYKKIGSALCQKKPSMVTVIYRIP